ncbi:MAG: two-component regulator propeller domain-containing protein [Bacteroidota bacterium]
MKLRPLCLLVLLCVQFFPVLAQKSDLFFEHFTTEDGLSQNDVNCIIQDSLGFMWFGTNDGLNRYDGYQVREFKPSEADSNSISSNLISCLSTDSRNRLWVGTTGFGLSCYDPMTEQFINYSHDPNVPSSLVSNQVLSIHTDRNNRLWVGTVEGLNLFELTTEENGFQGSGLRNITKKLIPPSLQEIQINVIYQVDEERFWIGTEAGVFTLKNQPNGRDYLTIETIVPNLNATDIEAYDANSMLVGGSTGLFYLDMSKRDPLSGRVSPQILDARAHNQLIVHHGEVWTASTFGLSRFASSFGERLPRLQNRYVHDLRVINSLNKTVLRCIYADQNGLIWLGTNGGGVNRFDPEKKVFSHHKQQLEPGSISNDKIRSVFEDSRKNLWIGTEGGGVNFLPAGPQREDYHNFDQLGTPSYCFAIEEYEEEGIPYILMGGQAVPSLYRLRLDEIEQGVREELLTPIPEVKGSVFAILNQDNQYIWTGTYSQGLFRIPVGESEDSLAQFTHEPREPHSMSSSLIRSLMMDHAGNLWIGTGSGLNLLLADERTRAKPVFKHFFHHKSDSTSLSHDYILALHESKKQEVWIATFGGGLNKYVPGNGSEHGHFVRYTEEDGLPNNVVKGILEDEEGYLWISTNKGLSRFDPVNEVFHNYDTNDGLQSDEFSELAAYKLHNGEMIFGGVNGFNVFKADSLYNNPYRPNVVFTSFQILNTEVGVGEAYNDHVILPQSIPYSNEIRLTHDENSFSVEFAALHFSFQRPSLLEAFTHKVKVPGLRLVKVANRLEAST